MNTKNVSKLYDVVVAGAGPVGLFLAGELALQGAQVVVLERNERHASNRLKEAPFGIRGVNTLTLECLTRRGLLDDVFPGGSGSVMGKQTGMPTRPLTKTPGKPQMAGHFGGLFLDANRLDLGRWPYRINGPGLVPGPTTMAAVERVFGERARRLGVTMAWGEEVKGIEEKKSDGPVEVRTAKDNLYQGRWLVGCDGGRSTVRRMCGFATTTTEPLVTGYAIECEIERGGGGADHHGKGFVMTDRGMYAMLPSPDQKQPKTMLYLLDYDHGKTDRSDETHLQIDHLQDVVDRVMTGQDVRLLQVHAATSFTDRSKHAQTYRKGRVLLAGDAAHTHAAFGAQGMNLGIGDAMNLGWKLGGILGREGREGSERSEEKGRIEGKRNERSEEKKEKKENERSEEKRKRKEDLLDSYSTERIPVAADVLRLAHAQTMAMLPTPHGRATRWLMSQVLETDDGVHLLADRLWGLSVCYEGMMRSEGCHELVGKSMPDLVLRDGTRLNSRLVAGRGLLVEVGRSRFFEDHCRNHPNVDYTPVESDDARGITAMLVRPDGMVAWCDGGEEALEEAMDKWF